MRKSDDTAKEDFTSISRANEIEQPMRDLDTVGSKGCWLS